MYVLTNRFENDTMYKLTKTQLPVAQLDSASDSDSEGPRFESARAGQKNTHLGVFFLPQGSTGAKYERSRFAYFSITQRSEVIRAGRPKIDKLRLVDFLSIAKAMAYHHAFACISSPKVYIINRRLYYFRNDDIQDCILMICNALH